MANKPSTSKASIQAFLPIKEIRNNLIFLKDGSIKAVLKASGVNFYLMSTEEQDILVGTFQQMLNSLEFPIQILVQSRKIDLNNYLKSLEVFADNETNPLLKENYYEYIKFMKEVMSVSSIMDKNFYVVIPYFSDILTKQKQGFLASLLGSGPKESSSKDNLGNVSDVLGQRINSVAFSLQSLGIEAKQLSTQELIELTYSCYNVDSPRVGIKSEDIRNSENSKSEA